MNMDTFEFELIDLQFCNTWKQKFIDLRQLIEEIKINRLQANVNSDLDYVALNKVGFNAKPLADPPKTKNERINILKNMCDTSLCEAANAYIKSLNINYSELYKKLKKFDESGDFSMFFQEKYYLIETDEQYNNDLAALHELIRTPAVPSGPCWSSAPASASTHALRHPHDTVRILCDYIILPDERHVHELSEDDLDSISDFNLDARTFCKEVNTVGGTKYVVDFYNDEELNRLKLMYTHVLNDWL
ncbi:hypothetical protein AGLY_017947 [Aphis glycines]|uniref:Uncharacterized protein n=1 Tax=Aphis glycines TaxID=307491 RepID=A0A6G0SVB9_APHGL|nr:hypothetical protein AGLY_017947 [Aphis glycines]